MQPWSLILGLAKASFPWQVCIIHVPQSTSHGLHPLHSKSKALHFRVQLQTVVGSLMWGHYFWHQPMSRLWPSIIAHQSPSISSQRARTLPLTVCKLNCSTLQWPSRMHCSALCKCEKPTAVPMSLNTGDYLMQVVSVVRPVTRRVNKITH